MDTQNQSRTLGMRFLLPLIFDCSLSAVTTLFFNSIISSINGTTLASNSIISTVTNLLTAALAMISTGAAVLIARMVGEGNKKDTSIFIEQSLLLTGLSFAVISALIYIFVYPIVSLLMPNAEPEFYQNTVWLLRLNTFNFPLLALYTVGNALLRAAGRSRAALISTVITNVMMLIGALVFIGLLKMDIPGMGITFILCRGMGFVCAYIYIRREMTLFKIIPGRMLHPDFKIWKRISSIGFPMSIDQFFVQVGYLIANTIAVGMGAFAVTTYQIASSLYNFAAIPMSVVIPAVITVVGQPLGAGNLKLAKHNSIAALLWSTGSSLFFMTVLILLGPRVTSFFSSDPEVIDASSGLLWHFIFQCLFGSPINATDNVLRVGGQTRYVMVYTLVGVWVIRLPLSYIFCYMLDMGITGMLIANNIALAFRAACALYGSFKNKWLYGKV